MLSRGKEKYQEKKRKLEEDVGSQFLTNSTIARITTYSSEKLAQGGKFNEASACLDAVSLMLATRGESDDESDDEGLPDTFIPLDQDGKTLTCLLGTSTKEKKLEEYVRAILMMQGAATVRRCL